MYVEWLYHGDYTVAPNLFLEDEIISMDAKCWILGDKLFDLGFKNLAMARLYRKCTALGFLPRTITTHEVRFILENTGPDSKLRLLYLHMVVQHFSSPLRLKDTTEMWDDLLSEYTDAKLFFLQSFRTAPEQRNFVRAGTFYMDHELGLNLDRLTLKQ